MSNETHAFPAIAPLDPSDSSVFVNNVEIMSFSGAGSGYTRLLNLGEISNVDWPLVSAITALENHGSITAIRGPGYLYAALQSSALDIDIDGDFQFLNAPEGTLETNLRFAVRVRGEGEVLVSNAGVISGGDDGLRLQDVTAFVQNTGTITGSGDFFRAGFLDGDGFLIADLGNPNAYYYSDYLSEGITYLSTSGQDREPTLSTVGLTVHNAEGAVISGARGGINFSGSSAVLLNAGSITGNGSSYGAWGIFGSRGDSVVIRNSGEISQTAEVTVQDDEFGYRSGIWLQQIASTTIENSGSISGVDVGLRGYLTPIDLENTGTITGGLFAILSYQDADALPAAIHQLATISDVSSLPPGADTGPAGQFDILRLPEVAAETGGKYLLPQPRFDGDVGYLWAGTKLFPSTYTRPDGSTARIDLKTGLIYREDGKLLTRSDLEPGFDQDPVYLDVIVNHGTLQGDVNLGVGDDRMTNTGSIEGKVWLESGNDLFNGQGAPATAVTVSGGPGNDTLAGGGGGDNLAGGSDSDILNGFAGRDTLSGGEGADTLSGGLGADRLIGGPGNDVFLLSGADVLVEHHGGGIDTVHTDTSYTLKTYFENLVLTGSGPSNGTGTWVANSLSGNAAGNRLAGMEGNDSLEGRGGNDTLIGGQGEDTLIGGLGADIFEVDFPRNPYFLIEIGAANDVDTLKDFTHGTDKLQLSRTAFTNLGDDASQFLSAAGVTQPLDAAHRLIYDTSTGNLYYDSDGQAGDTLLIATLSNRPELDFTDFMITG